MVREAEHSGVQLKIESPPSTPPYTTSTVNKPFLCRRWLIFLIALNIFLLLAGQTSATLLNRFYFDKGGNSKWLSTLLQIAGFPILLPLFLIPSSSGRTSSTTTTTTALIYIGIGILIAADDMLYSYGVAFVPVSTFSLLCATQLAFNSVTSFFLNSQKFTPPILNSLILLIFSSVLLAVRSDSERPSGVSTAQYSVGFTCSLAASALYALILSLMQLSFQKYFKETFSAVLEMQVWTSVVATVACLVGLFASSDWRTISGEYHNFQTGKVSYVMTVVWSAIVWQIGSVGVVGLIFTVSALFSNVISTVALPLVPVLAVFVFHDKMDSVKLMSLLLSLWGFASYVYQQCVDAGKGSSFDFEFRKKKKKKEIDHDDSSKIFSRMENLFNSK